MGYIAALILAVLIIPILGMLYMDVLQMKHEAKTQIEKMDKLRRDIEKQQREKKDE